MGLGDTENRHCLTEITAFKGKDTIYQVAVGAAHTLFLNNSGTALYSCGRSDNGQLGLFGKVQGVGDFVMVPTKVPFPETTKNQRIAKITTGANISAVIMENGECYTWGSNVYAQTGHSSEARSILEPPKLNPLRGYQNRDPEKPTIVVGASFGAQHSLFLVQRCAKE